MDTSSQWKVQQLRLLSSQTQLVFRHEFRSLSVSEQLYKELTGRLPRMVKHCDEPGLVIRSSKNREIVDWDKDSCTVIVESELPLNERIERMVELIETVNKIAPIEELSERHLITCWLKPVKISSFKELERKYRETMMIKQPVWGKTFDSSVILDAKIGKFTLHHQSGPMKIQQLRKDYTTFSLNNIPNVFLFLLVSIWSKELVKYTYKDIYEFLTSSSTHCENHSVLFENIWGEAV